MIQINSVETRGPHLAAAQRVLTPQALDFVRVLCCRHAEQLKDLLAARARRRADLQGGASLDFLPETAAIRDGDWRVPAPAPGLLDRRVEITGPTDRKMAINALNSGANVWMADFEDANSPTWHNMITGQANLLDAVEQHLELTSDDGRHYALGDDLATIVVRPRGLHMVDDRVLADREPVPAGLLDFALYLFHCGQRQIQAGSGPYFYLPKLEHHLEARWWNELFLDAQALLGIPSGTIRATVLIETLPAAFQMQEILYELREHAAGLNAGRWDYLFSVIKTLGHRPQMLLPDRAEVNMGVPFMRAYTQLLVSTCHRRGAYAIGGMSAHIPSRDTRANAVALANVHADKQREADDGFDGSWIAHPGLVETCRDAFDQVLAGRANQLERRNSEHITADDLLAVDKTPGRVTRDGITTNITVALRYLDSWLRGTGAVMINNLMEDAATAEISRSQLRQWIDHRVPLPDGAPVTHELIHGCIEREFVRLNSDAGPESRLGDARTVLHQLLDAARPPEFFTTGSYARVRGPWPGRL